MAVYFFDVDEGDGLVLDDEGLEFAGPREARDEAARLLLELAKDALPMKGELDYAVRIRDEDARSICVVTLALAAAEWPAEGGVPTASEAAPTSQNTP
jgi:hypothetical protein